MCLCCHIQACCFGFRELQPGVFILAVVSMMINLVLMMAPYLVFPVVNQNGYQMWLLILLMCDISLAIGTKLGNKVLILPWLIAYMIMIIITCIAAPIIIIMSSLVVKEARSYSPEDAVHNQTIQTLTNNMPEQRDLEKEALDTLHRFHPDNIQEEDIRPLGAILVSVLLPAWYLYTWVASKSLYHILSLQATPSSSAGFRRSNRVVAWSVVPGQVEATTHPPGPTPLPWYADHPRNGQVAQYHPPPTLIYTSSEPGGGISVSSSSSYNNTNPIRY